MLQVVWSRGKHPISASQRISRKVIGSRHSLLFQKVIAHDLTTYSCTATNALGSDQRTVLLTGVAREAVFKSDVSSAEEDSFTLIWEVESYTTIINFKLEFRKVNPSNWTELVIPADGASALVHSKRFTLRGLSRASTYEAVVRSRNEYGWSPPSEVFPFNTKGGSAEQMDTTEVTSQSGDDVEGESGVDVEQVEEKAAIQSAIPRPHWTQGEHVAPKRLRFYHRREADRVFC
ncbi:hypothetical protein J437_LFUL007359 [Ladona fulva]|uniref:Fibronectin type-III domain-containing protein n=1 Tax=Ladona fulva TaxID=123851 RepID=A0A8K0P830_LADFU|nr:hypothetical protein J437_LFUL007359 [Ladona fulva]